MRSGAVGTQPPKPTSASQGSPINVTRNAMCVRGRGGAPGGAIQRTRPTRPSTWKPTVASTRLNRTVLLVAVAAPAGGDQLRVDRGRGEVDAPIEQHVDRLEDDRRRMQLVQRPKRLEASAFAGRHSRCGRNRRRGRPRGFLPRPVERGDDLPDGPRREGVEQADLRVLPQEVSLEALAQRTDQAAAERDQVEVPGVELLGRTLGLRRAVDGDAELGEVLRHVSSTSASGRGPGRERPRPAPTP